MISKIKKICLVFMLFFLVVICVGCSTKDNNDSIGSALYSLDDAYRLKKLSGDDLLQIKNHHDSDDKYPEELNSEIELKIKESAQFDVDSTEDIEIVMYYGQYNDSYVVMLRNKNEAIIEQPHTDSIANVDFDYQNNNEILVWIETISYYDQIKLDYLKEYVVSRKPLDTIDNVKIDEDFGKYNDASVLFIKDTSTEYALGMAKETILDYVFGYDSFYCPLAYYEHSFYTLKDAYKNNILTSKSLSKLVKKFPATDADSRFELNGAPITE